MHRDHTIFLRGFGSVLCRFALCLSSHKLPTSGMYGAFLLIRYKRDKKVDV